MVTNEIEAVLATSDPTEAFRRRMAAGRAAANPDPTVRLQCPTLEHGDGVLLYVAGGIGWCHCGAKLRTLAPWELLERVTGRVVPVRIET